MKNSLNRKGLLIFILSSVLLTAVIVLSAGAVLSGRTSSVSLRQQTEKGNVAIADFNSTNGITVFSGNGIRKEIYTDYGIVYAYSDAEENILRGENTESLFISGTYDNSAVVFYVKETDEEVHAIEIITKTVDEAQFFAGMDADGNAASSVSMAVCFGEEVSWRTVTDNSKNTSVTTELMYSDCPFDESKNAYQIILRVDSGMTEFESIKLTGLEIVALEDEKNELYYDNGVLMQGNPDAGHSVADAASYIDFNSVREILSSDNKEDLSIYKIPLSDFFARLYAFLVKLIDILKSFSGGTI